MGALTLLGATVTPSEAAPPVETIRCGQTIKHSLIAANDIGPCPGDGLVIVSNGITLDLGGHSVIGSNLTNTTDAEQVGVRFRRVARSRLANGTVRNFDAGVVIGGGRANTVSSLTVEDNINHAAITGADNPCEFGDGILVNNSDGNRIKNTRAAHNGPYSGISLVGDSDNNLISVSKAARNDVPNVLPNGDTGPCGSPFARPNQDIGIRIEGPGADGNTVEANEVIENQLNGIAIHGFVCNPPAGDPQPDNTGNVIKGNLVERNGFAGATETQDGIAILEQGPADVVCVASNNSILDNVSRDNARYGIYVGGRGSGGNTISGNGVYGNGRDGIHLTGPLDPGETEGTTNNTLVANKGSGNVAFDGYDGNPNCDNNVWQDNEFTTANQPCVDSPAPPPT